MFLPRSFRERSSLVRSLSVPLGRLTRGRALGLPLSPALILLLGLLPACELPLNTGVDPRLPEVNYHRVAAEGTFSCGLSVDGEAYCWGVNHWANLGSGPRIPLLPQFQPLPVSGGHRFVELAVGLTHACALEENGTAWCWGSNHAAQLGPGGHPPPNTCRDAPCAAQPTLVTSELRFRSLTAGSLRSCGTTEGGELVCWGSNTFGERGSGDFGPPSSELVSVGIPEGVPGARLTGLTLGRQHSCALDAEGGAWCWGRNESGQLGSETGMICGGGDPSGTCSPVPIPVAPDLRFQSLAAGEGHTCGLGFHGEVHCWGANHFGQLGSPVLQVRGMCKGGALPGPCSLIPLRVPAPAPIRALSVGGRHSCGIAEDGTAWCWGDNRTGAVGDCTIRAWVPEPSVVCGDHQFVELAGGSSHHCGIRTDGSAWCWGLNDHGQLGSSTHTAFGPRRVVRPFAVPGG